MPEQEASGGEFYEIGHSGGKITFHVRTDAEGRRSYQIEYRFGGHARVAIIGVYALPPGIPVARIELGGIGSPWNPPPFPGCLAVFVASDSEGRFGHNCPSCDGYWRSEPWPNVCPYCGDRAPEFQFFSKAQRRYVADYCHRLVTARTEPDGDVVIDMDAVAEAVGKEGTKPPFYVSEVSQQHKFKCAACGAFNDILGRFGYCSSCGTRNDLGLFRGVTVPAIRDRLNASHPPEDCVRDAVASFDSFLGQYAKELVSRVPMTKERKARLSKRFHNAGEIRDTFARWFDIDLGAGIKPDAWELVKRLFLRRHLYEHNGGEVDQKYLDESGDTSVKLKQHIRETKKSAHDLLGALLRMAANTHDGFHELLPPISEPIVAFEKERARLAKLRSGAGA